MTAALTEGRERGLSGIWRRIFLIAGFAGLLLHGPERSRGESTPAATKLDYHYKQTEPVEHLHGEATPAAAAKPEKHEGESLMGALILATNEKGTVEIPAELIPHLKQLSAFGYRHFRLLSQSKKAFVAGTEEWTAQSPHFTLKIDSAKPLPKGHAVKAQLLQDGRNLVEAEFHICRDHPLYIRGPLVGKGQLIVLLAVE